MRRRRAVPPRDTIAATGQALQKAEAQTERNAEMLDSIGQNLMATADPGSWPLRVDVEYAENGPELLCDGWRLEEAHYPPGAEFTVPCGWAIGGSTPDEIRARAAKHIATVPHVPPGFRGTWPGTGERAGEE